MDKQLNQAEKEAQAALNEWNRFIDKALDGNGFVDPVERQMKLDAWAVAENRAGEIRRKVGRNA